MSPVPSLYDDAAGEVSIPIPSNTVNPCVAVALAGDMSSKSSLCDLCLASSVRYMHAPVF